MSVVVNFNANGTLAVTSSTVSALGNFITAQSIAADSCMVYNAGSNVAFVAFGKTSVTASVPTTEKSNATPVAAGAIMVLTKGVGNDAVATITSTQSGTMYFTAGQGN